MIQTILMKLFSFVSQIALAWILTPNEFGKIALVYTITNITTLMQHFGLQDVLIKRGKSFKLWLPQSYGITIFVSIISTLVVILLAYFSSLFYDDRQIFYLLLIFSFSMPFQAFSNIPDTYLKIENKFKELSIIKVFEFFLIQSGIIVFAIFGFKTYSFIYPVVIVAIIRCVFLFNYTKISWVSILYRRSKYLVSQSLNGFFFALFTRLVTQVDVIILGFIASQSEIGAYFMAMTLSIQVIGLIGNSLPTVLFPALMKSRESNVFSKETPLIKTILYIALIGVPIAFLQIVTAEPIVRLFLEDKWVPSIKFVEILSFGMAFRVIASNWVVPLKLKGHFFHLAKISFFSLIQFIVILIPFAYYNNIYGVAVGVSLYYLLNTPYLIYSCLVSYGIDFKALFSNCFKIVFAGVLSFGLPYLISFNFLFFEENLMWKLLFSVLFSILLYVFFIRILLKDIFYESLEILRKFI